MTLILGAATRYRAFHASDRFVSVPRTSKNPAGAYDLHSNKTVVVTGSDCWLTIGYTGLAYLGRKPTDQVLAEAISGIDDLSGAGMGAWFEPHLHYREITDRISHSLADGYVRASKAEQKYPVEVLGVGLQKTTKRRGGKPRLRHVMFRIMIRDFTLYHQEMGDRYLPFWSFNRWAVGSVDWQIFDEMSQRLRGAQSPEEFRDSMIRAVADTGAESPVVGEDVMSVTLEPLSNKIGIYFHPNKPGAQGTLTASTLSEDFAGVPSVATPWVFAHGMMYPPSIGTGGWVNVSSGLEIEVTGFQHDTVPGRMYFASQQRQPRPR